MDNLWKQHLKDMDFLKEFVGLRSSSSLLLSSLELSDTARLGTAAHFATERERGRKRKRERERERERC